MHTKFQYPRMIVLAFLLSLLVAVIGLHGTAIAGPSFINYKANLTDTQGEPVPDDIYQITFRIYVGETGGTAEWTEEHTVSTHNGSFFVKLGKNTPLDETIFGGELLWLGMTVFPDEEMEPRTQIGSVPWAMNSAYAERVKDKSVGSAQMADKAVGRGQVADKAVGQGQLGDKSVGKGQIGDKAVGGGQLEDRSVGNGHLDDGSVGNGKIMNGAVGLNKIAQDGAEDGQIIKWDTATSSWILGSDETEAGSTPRWEFRGQYMRTTRDAGIVRFGGTVLGTDEDTHLNLGNQSTTGTTLPGSSRWPTVGGGFQNTATFEGSTVSGGKENSATGKYSTVSGGEQNLAAAQWATISGGQLNEAGGDYSSVPGGAGNAAMGNSSFAAGRGAKAMHDGSIVLSAALETEGQIESGDSSQIVLKASGGIYLADDNVTPPTFGPSKFMDTSTGAYLSTSGVWESVSARDTKENFTAIDRQQLLDTIDQLEITRWNYKIDGTAIQHIGPVAEDFHAAFGVGGGNKTISSLDPAGIALAAVQELNRRVEELRIERERATDLEQRVDVLSHQVEELLRQLKETK